MEAPPYKRIAQNIYDQHIDKVKQDISLAEMAAQDAKARAVECGDNLGVC
jgi:hypothetical protein